jgi:ABC-type lipoprotein release transport system permease subunit
MALARLLTFRSLKSRPLRMFFSTFGIILGVAAILSIGITNQTAMDAITRLFEDTSGKADLVVVSRDQKEDGFSERILFRVEELPEIVAAVPSFQVQTVLADQASNSDISLSFFGTNSGGLTLYGIDPTLDNQVRDYKIVAGEFLSSDLNANEVVLVEDYALDNEIEVGRRVEIVTDSGIQKLRVIGLMAKQGPGQLNNGAFGVIPLNTSQKLFYLEDKFDQIDLVVLSEYKGKDKLENLKRDIQDHLG